MLFQVLPSPQLIINWCGEWENGPSLLENWLYELFVIFSRLTFIVRLDQSYPGIISTFTLKLFFPGSSLRRKKNGKIPIPEQNLRMTIERGFLLQIPILSFPIFAGLRSSCIWAGWLRADQASWKVEFGLSSIKLGTISLSLIHIWELRSDKGRWAVSE